MDFADRIQAIASRAPDQVGVLQTEEATKTALIMPFIRALGYDVFDPHEVVPEFTADHGVKAGEKVDYAILRNGKPEILIEAKWVGIKLKQSHVSQLYRYFSVTDARVGILTNGIEYEFYTDLVDSNRMDQHPFFSVSLTNLRPGDIDDVKRFTKEEFNLESLEEVASSLKYIQEIRQLLSRQMRSPEPEFVKYLIHELYRGRAHPKVQAQFTEYAKRAFNQLFTDKMNEHIRAYDAFQKQVHEDAAETNDADIVIFENPERGIVTTQEEINGYELVKSLVGSVVAEDRVTIRDTKSYCGVILDDNNRKPICRLHFNSQNKYLGVLDEDKNETKYLLASVDDIADHADLLRSVAARYVDSGDLQT